MIVRLVRPQRFQLRHQPADGLVHPFRHRRIGGVIAAAGICAACVVFNQFPLGLDGPVDGVVGQVEKERAVSIGFDEVLGLGGEPVRQIVAVFGSGHLDERMRRNHALVRVPVSAGEAGIKAAVFRTVPPAAHVPFADARCRVAGFRERCGNHCFAQRAVLWATRLAAAWHRAERCRASTE